LPQKRNLAGVIAVVGTDRMEHFKSALPAPPRGEIRAATATLEFD
jgi:hypothetical protein